MYIYVDVAKRDRKDHFNGIDKGIKQGESHLILCNGTIGQGRRTQNINNTDSIKMLKGLIKKLKKTKVKSYDKEYLLEKFFTVDDIPF